MFYIACTPVQCPPSTSQNKSFTWLIISVSSGSLDLEFHGMMKHLSAGNVRNRFLLQTSSIHYPSTNPIQILRTDFNIYIHINETFQHQTNCSSGKYSSVGFWLFCSCSHESITCIGWLATQYTRKES